MNATRIGPSLLAADFARLAEDIARVERGGADFLHLDVMDGHFVPNISFGLPVVAAVRQTTCLELNTHLMLQDPLPFIGPFKEAGARTRSSSTWKSNRPPKPYSTPLASTVSSAASRSTPNTPRLRPLPLSRRTRLGLSHVRGAGIWWPGLSARRPRQNPRPVRGNRAPWARHTRRHRRRSPSQQR